MQSQGQVRALNAQWTHRWSSGPWAWHRDWDTRGSLKVLERTSCHYGHDFHTVLKTGRQLYQTFPFVLKKVRRVSENRIRRKQIGAFCWRCCSSTIIVLSEGAQQEAANCVQFWHLPPFSPRPTMLTLEILMRCINYSYRVPSQIE